jgi:hypothetical protein
MSESLGWTVLSLDGAEFPCGCRLELRRDGAERWVRLRYCPTHTPTINAVSSQVLRRLPPCDAR